MLEYIVSARGCAGEYLRELGSRLPDAESREDLQAVVAVRDGRLLGMVTFEIENEICFLYDYTVAEEYRSFGIGTILFYKLTDHLKDVEEVYEIRYIFTREDEKTRKFQTFLDKLGFTRDSKRGDYAEFTLADCMSSAFFKKCPDDTPGLRIVSVGDYSEAHEVMRLEQLLEDCPWNLSVRQMFTDYEPEYSVVAEEGEEAVGFLLTRQVYADVLQLSYLYVSEEHKLALIPMLKRAGKIAEDGLGHELILQAFLSNEEAQGAADKILSNIKRKPVVTYYMYLDQQ